MITVSRRVPPELLFDSEASLRSAAGLLRELQRAPAPASAMEPRDIATLPEPLARAYGEICTVLDMLTRSRTVIERTTLDRVGVMNEKLREVSTATELAATDMLDGLDRAIGCIDRLDARAAADAEPADGADRAQLREELYRLIGCLQFQDITSQQLAYASTTLEDLEVRIRAIAQLFDLGLLEGAEADQNPSVAASDTATVTFDPAASTRDAEVRQALADEIFG